MNRLSAVMKNRISEALEATHFRQQGFTVSYDDENSPMASITFSDSPEYRFVINSGDNNLFATVECPGIHSYSAEIFQRNDFEQCLHAIQEWVERIRDREGDWIMDEFGGVADSNPAYFGHPPKKS